MFANSQIQLIQQSFAKSDTKGEEVIAYLLQSLFRRDPGLRYLFPAELQDLKRRFGFMLGHLVRRLDRWDEIVPRLRNLGVRHVSYGVEERHYQTFGLALLEALERVLDISQDSQAGLAWKELYAQVSAEMISAANGVTVDLGLLEHAR